MLEDVLAVIKLRTGALEIFPEENASVDEVDGRLGSPSVHWWNGRSKRLDD